MTDSRQSQAQAFLSPSTPLVDAKTGIITPPWRAFLVSLWARTGGGQGASSADGGNALVELSLEEGEYWQPEIIRLQTAVATADMPEAPTWPSPQDLLQLIQLVTEGSDGISYNQLPPMPNLTMLGNISGGFAPPTPLTFTSWLDATMGSARGDLIYRGASNWAALALGASGNVLTSNGTDVLWAPPVGPALIPDLTIESNISGGPAAPVPNTLTAILDACLATSGAGARGALIVRGLANWAPVYLGPSGFIFGSNGTDAVWTTTFTSTGVATDTYSWAFQRNATYTGGTPGFVSTAITVQDGVAAGILNNEWALLSKLTSSSATGEHVAIYAQSQQLAGAGTIWGMVSECLAGVAGSVGVGLEIDVTRTAAGNVVALDIVNRALGFAGSMDYAIRIPYTAIHGISGSDPSGFSNNLHVNPTAYGFATNASWNFRPTDLYSTADFVPGEGFNTYLGFYCGATSRQEPTREFMATFNFASETGYTHGNGVDGDRVCLSAMMEARNGTGNVWALYPVLILNPGSYGLFSYIAQGMEIDVNNNTGVNLTALGNPSAFGISVTGAGLNISTAAIQITGLRASDGGPNWYNGIMFNLNSIQNFTINDNSNSDKVLYVTGTHTIGIDMSGAVMTSAAINISNGQSIFASIAPNADNAYICGYIGQAWAHVNAYDFHNTSDERKKQDIEDFTGGLDLVRAVPPISFRWRTGDAQHKRNVGFSAQSMRAALPPDSGLIGGDDDNLSLSTHQVLAALWSAVRELDQRITLQ